MARKTGETTAAGATGIGQALDAGRGLAILAVLYGHALAPWFADAGDRINELAFLQWKFGAAFMMPFFFYVSGVAWRAEKTLWATLRECLTLIFIAIAASIVLDLFVLGLTLAGAAEAAAQAPMSWQAVLGMAVRMVSIGDDYSLAALWFLPVLALARLLAAITARIAPWAGIAAGLALFAIYLVAEAEAWRNVYQIKILWAGFFAFIAGHASRGAFETLERRPGHALAIAAIGFVVTALGAGFNRGCQWEFDRWCGLAFLGGDRFGVSMFAGSFGYLPLFVVTAISGVVFAAAASIVLAQHGGVVGAMVRRWGRNSMNILIVNAVFLELLNPLLSRDVAPRIAGDQIWFFPVLFALAVAANLAAAQLLRPALARLRLGARGVACAIVDVLRWHTRAAAQVAS